MQVKGSEAAHRHVYIDGKLKYIHGVGSAPHGWVKLKVGETHTVPTAEHMVPAGWWDQPTSGRIYTGGHWFSTQPGGDLTPPKAG